MLLSVDNDRCYLLVHEEKYGEENGRDGCSQVDVPGGVVVSPGDDPDTQFGIGRLSVRVFIGLIHYYCPQMNDYLKNCGHNQLWSLKRKVLVNEDKYNNGENDSIVRHQGASLKNRS